MSTAKSLWLTLLALLSPPTLASQPAKLPDGHFHSECRIYSPEGNLLRKLPGGRCIFLPDGGLISATKNSILRYSPNMKVLWGKMIHFHHQLNLSFDGKRILANSSSFRDYSGKKNVRFDRLVVLDLQGKELHSFDFFEHRRALAGKLFPKEGSFSVTELSGKATVLVPEGSEEETSHMNSFHEIGENALSQTNPAFRPGNYIANDYYSGLVLVLDSRLSKILWHTKLSDSSGKPIHAHDVQVQKNGWLSFFINRRSPTEDYSLAAEFHPITRKLETIYQAPPKSPMRSRFYGSLQRLDEARSVISHNTNDEGGVVLVENGRRIGGFANPEIDQRTGRPRYFPEVRWENLTEFLKNNSPL